MTLEVTLCSQSAAESDEDLVARAWGGDDEALTTLLRRYRDVVRAKACSYFLVGADREDVVQEGMIGLYKAIRDFDPSRQATFRTFAEMCVTRQIVSAIKMARRKKHVPLNSYVSLYLPVSLGDEVNAELVENVACADPGPAESVVSSAEIVRMEEYFGENLSALEAEVLQRYLEGHSYREIALELDRHVKSVDNAVQRIKRKLDCYLADRRLEEAS